MQISQQLLNTDNERRLRFRRQINGLSEGRLDVNTIFLAMSHIYVYGYINKQNFQK